jgi:hypothetical protein
MGDYVVVPVEQIADLKSAAEAAISYIGTYCAGLPNEVGMIEALQACIEKEYETVPKQEIKPETDLETRIRMMRESLEYLEYLQAKKMAAAKMVADPNGDFIRIEDLSEQIAIEGSRLGPANAKSIEAALEYQRQYGGTIMRRYVSEWERVVYDGAAELNFIRDEIGLSKPEEPGGE